MFLLRSVLKRGDRGEGERGTKSSRKPKGTLREPTQQHRPTQNTEEVEKVALEHKPTETENSSNHTKQKPEQTRPPRPPAQTPNANPRQRHKTTKQAGEKKGRHAQAQHGGAGQTPVPEPTKPRQRGSTRPTSEEGRRVTGRRNE
jgi:hypothetical protein